MIIEKLEVEEKWQNINAVSAVIFMTKKKRAKALEAALDTGKNVVFLTLGDPTIYSTFSYVQKRVEEDGYETRLVSGITSFCATAARLNIPLTEWNQPLHVQPAVHRLDSELDQPGKDCKACGRA